MDPGGRCVREQTGEDETVVYTDSVYGYSVTVIDNDDGTLAFDQGFVDAAERYIPCETCSGTGHVAEDTPCDTCGGTGKVWNPDWTPAAIEDLPVLTNTLEDGALSITKLTADAPEDDETEFTFRVVLPGDKAADGAWDSSLPLADDDPRPRPRPRTRTFQPHPGQTPRRHEQPHHSRHAAG